MAFIDASVLGVSNGMFRIVNGVTWAHFYGRHRLGRIQGTATMVTISALAIGPLPQAALQGLTGSFALGIALMAFLPIASVAEILVTRPQQVPYLTEHEVVANQEAG